MPRAGRGAGWSPGTASRRPARPSCASASRRRPATLAALPYYAFHPLGVEQRRADTIRRATARAAWLEAIVDLPIEEAYARLTALPGIGPWTAAEVAVRALGDPDAVSVGDFHLPNLVAFALAGEPRGDDARMLELLEPWRGERARVIRLLELSGHVRAEVRPAAVAASHRARLTVHSWPVHARSAERRPPPPTRTPAPLPTPPGRRRSRAPPASPASTTCCASGSW